MEAQTYLKALWRARGWILIGIVIAGAISAGVSIFLLRPVYQTTMTLLVNFTDPLSNTTGYSAALASEQLASTYAQLVTEQEVLAEAIARAGVADSPDRLRERIKVEAPPNTAVIRVTIEGNNPTALADLANALADVFAAHVARWQEEAGMLTSPGSPEVVSLIEGEREHLAQTLDAYARTYSDLMVVYTELTNQMLAGQPARAAVLPQEDLDALDARIRAEMTQSEQAIAALEQRLQELDAQSSWVGWRDELARLEGRLYEYRSLYSNLLSTRWAMSQTGPTAPPAEQATSQLAALGSVITAVQAQIASLTDELSRLQEQKPAGDQPWIGTNERELVWTQLEGRRAEYARWVEAYMNFLQLRQANTLPEEVKVDVEDLTRRRTEISAEAEMIWGQMQEVRRRLESFDEVKYEPAGPSILQVSKATPPAKPVSPNLVLNVVIAGGLALVVGALVALFLEYLRLAAEPPIGARG